LAAASLTVAPSIAGADTSPTRVPGTQIELVPPAGFEVRAAFPGFIRLDIAGSVMAIEFPQSYAAMVDDVMARSKTPGVKLLSTEHPRVSGQEATLLHVQVPFDQTSDMAKWMLVFGDGSHTGTVTATFRANVSQATDDAIRKSVLSAHWSDAAPLSALEGLQFRITESARLKISHRIANGIFLVAPGRWGRTNPADPILGVTAGVLIEPVADADAFSKAQLERRSFTEVEILNGAKIEVGKLPGFELTARA
jgi:hypothetical protein